MGKKNKILSKLRDKGKNPYPFINPIIVTSELGIVDGQHRFEVCKRTNSGVLFVILAYTHNDLKNENFIRELRYLQEMQRIALEEWFVKNNISYLDQLQQCSSVDRMAKFIEFENLFESDKKYWEELADCYNLSDNNYKLASEIKRLFSSKRANREHLMLDNEVRFLNSLPEVVLIYRGMSTEEFESNNFGISWSLKKRVAEKYANEYYHNYDTHGVAHTVVELKITRSQIVAYFSERNEEEIIYLHNTN